MYLYTGIEKQKTYTHIIYIYICYAMCVRQCVWTLCVSITKCGHIESMSYCLHPRFLHERPVTLSKGSWPRISSRWVASWAVWWVIWPSFRTGRCHGWRMVKEKIELRFSNLSRLLRQRLFALWECEDVVDPGQLDAFMNSVWGCENIWRTYEELCWMGTWDKEEKVQEWEAHFPIFPHNSLYIRIH